MVRKRCAVYCRVSTDERLDQSFNSIDAQRERTGLHRQPAGTGVGFPVVDDYDDGGFSGGNMDRPALSSVLADIDAGRSTSWWVSKIDRTTHLADFARWWSCSISAVSFQCRHAQINSATSMGRLMLNILLSFAQFERGGDWRRIRDKIAARRPRACGWAARRRWVTTSATDNSLSTTPRRRSCTRHLAAVRGLRSTTELARELNQRGVTTKAWTTQDGVFRPGQPITKAEPLQDAEESAVHRRHPTCPQGQKTTLASTSQSWIKPCGIRRKPFWPRMRICAPTLQTMTRHDNDRSCAACCSPRRRPDAADGHLKKKSGKRYRYLAVLGQKFRAWHQPVRHHCQRNR